jgi:hypothetical protein
MPGIKIPRIWTTVNEKSKSPGYIFLTPRVKLGQQTGPTILDAEGHVVWFHALSRTRTAINLDRQTYLGNPVLTWGQRPPLGKEGALYSGNAHTVYNVIADENYHVIARVRARGNGINTDLHEFQITKRDTALVLGFRKVSRNLSRYGGPAHSAILDNVVQEIDIKTGKVLLDWSAANRLSPAGSYVKAPPTGAWDAYHINAISEDTDANLLLTSRHLSTIVKIDRRTGRVLWKLGGRDSDFKLSSSAQFYFPHDAQRAPDGTLTVFDNRSTALDKSRGPSRGLRLRLDTSKRTVSVARAVRHPGGNIFSTSQGNVTQLAGGNVFVGWGSSPWFSEYAPDGRLLFAAHTRSAWNQSYRAFKTDWAGRPTKHPAITARTTHGSTAVYVSWNGSTEVKQWRVLAGASSSVQPVATVPKTDFETKFVVPGVPAVVQVEALDAAGNVLDASDQVKPTA